MPARVTYAGFFFPINPVVLLLLLIFYSGRGKIPFSVHHFSIFYHSYGPSLTLFGRLLTATRQLITKTKQVNLQE